MELVQMWVGFYYQISNVNTILILIIHQSLVISESSIHNYHNSQDFLSLSLKFSYFAILSHSNIFLFQITSAILTWVKIPLWNPPNREITNSKSRNIISKAIFVKGRDILLLINESSRSNANRYSIVQFQFNIISTFYMFPRIWCYDNFAHQVL